MNSAEAAAMEMNPVPIAPTLSDATDLTVAVDLSGPAEARPPPLPSAPTLDGNAYRQRIRDYLRKAVNEAKVNTHWLHPNEKWIEACDRFVDALMVWR